MGINLGVFSDSLIDKTINGKRNRESAEHESTDVRLYVPIKFHEVPDLMRKSELGKARVNVEAIKQQTAELFPYTGDKRLFFLFLACEVHPASMSKDMELFLGQVIEALVLVKQVQAHAPVKSNLISYLENGSLLEHIK